MAGNIVRELEQIASRRKQLVDMGRRLVQELNRVLPEIGYRVVAAGQAPPIDAEAEERGPVTRLEGRKRLRCTRCDRTFGQPMNLGRHMAATHGAQSQSRRSRGRGRKKAA